MKLLLIFSLWSSVLLSQDTLEGYAESYVGKVVAIDSSYIGLIKEGDDIISIAPIKVIDRVILESGEVIVNNYALQVGSDHELWNIGTKQLSGKQPSQLEYIRREAMTHQESNSSSVNKYIDEQYKSGTAERSAIALEKIALVLQVELAIGIAFIVISLIVAL